MDNVFSALAMIMIYGEYIGICLILGIALLITLFIKPSFFFKTRAILGMIFLIMAGILYLLLQIGI